MSGKHLVVLAVDDQKGILAALESVLHEDGHQVMTATSGLAGLALAEQEHPDVILLDIRMPDMDGIRMLQVLKQSPATGDIPVILLTGDSNMDLMERGFRLGAYDYLRKPFNPIELRIRIRHVARLKQASDQVLYLQELNRLKEDFIAVISHELRTPLTAILGFTELLLSGAAGPLTPEQVPLQEVVSQRSADLNRMIDELLEFNLIRACQRSLTPQEVSLRALVERVVDQMRILQAHHELHLDVHLPDPDVAVVLDPRAVSRVLSVLLGNALKFTPAGGTITLEARVGQGQLTMRVSDTGIGIPIDKLPVVFQCFRQLEGHETRRYEGLGLGLSIAKDLVELHGGRIWAESEKEQGSTFTVVLPQTARPEPLHYQAGVSAPI